MIAYSRQISLFSVVVVLTCCVYVISRYPSPDRFTALALPTGTDTPEGVACDIVRAYIAKDVCLYDDSRCKVSCENAFDATEAYATLLQYKPTSLNTLSQPTLELSDKLKIITASVRSKPEANRAADRWATTHLRNLDLFLSFGALDVRLVDIVVQTPNGHEYLFPVEVMHIADAANYGQPSGIWRGRLAVAPAIVKGK